MSGTSDKAFLEIVVRAIHAKFLRAFAAAYLARRRTPALTARGDCVAGDVHRDGRDRGRHVESA